MISMRVQVSGTSNPYCTLYVTTDKKNPRSTSCKPETLNPVWNETYNLELQVERSSNTAGSVSMPVALNLTSEGMFLSLFLGGGPGGH